MAPVPLSHTPWTDALRRTELGPAVFEVAPSWHRAVRVWAERQDVATATGRLAHFPSVDAWAVLDGGITAIYGYGLTTLRRGVRVVGFGAFRLLVADLGLVGPVEPFDGETPMSLDELRRRHGRPPTADDAEQAELLAECTDARLLRWVATALAPQGVEVT